MLVCKIGDQPLDSLAVLGWTSDIIRKSHSIEPSATRASFFFYTMFSNLNLGFSNSFLEIADIDLCSRM